MTLIEVLVATAMVAIMGTLVYGGFAQTARNKRTVERQVDRYHAIGAALERMASEISQAYVSIHVNSNTALQTMLTSFVGESSGFGDRLDFNSLSHIRMYRNARESDQNELSYLLTHSVDGETNVLARRVQPRPDDQPGEGGRVEVLLEDVLELDFEYLDPISQEWVEKWDTLSPAGQMNRLPAQVKIRIVVPGILDEREEEVFGTRATLGLQWAMNHAVYTGGGT
jgi:general secretion pathway protein J